MVVPRSFTLAFVAVALLATAAARGADTAAEITLQRALDAPLDLTLDKVELGKAFEAIAAHAKVSVQVDEACFDALPYGATTKVSATFRATPLRGAIEEILAPLALEQAVSGATLIIRPSAALARIGRRADWDELKLLQTLRTQELPKLDINWTDDLRTLLGKPQLVVDIDKVDPAVQDKAMAQVRAMLPCPAAQALDSYAAAIGMIWSVRTMPAEGQKIIIEPAKNWLNRQLREPVILSFTNAPLAKVVADLADASRIRFQPEPGLYLAVPAVSLTSNHSTVQQTLDTLSGATGIAYELRDDGTVLLRLAGKPNPNANPRPDAIIGRVAVPTGKDNTVFDLYIHESDLPAELNEMRKKKLREAIDALQQSLTPVPPTPAPLPPPPPPAPVTTAATAPATTPTTATRPK